LLTKDDIKSVEELKNKLISAGDWRNETPLHYAAERGFNEIVKMLIEHGADINVQTSVTHRTPLHYAVRGNRVEVTRLLLEGGADKSIVDNNKRAAFYYAKQKRYGEISNMLREGEAPEEPVGKDLPALKPVITPVMEIEESEEEPLDTPTPSALGANGGGEEVEKVEEEKEEQKVEQAPVEEEVVEVEEPEEPEEKEVEESEEEPLDTPTPSALGANGGGEEVELEEPEEKEVEEVEEEEAVEVEEVEQAPVEEEPVGKDLPALKPVITPVIEVEESEEKPLDTPTPSALGASGGGEEVEKVEEESEEPEEVVESEEAIEVKTAARAPVPPVPEETARSKEYERQTGKSVR
jgi:hypothetical protein